MLVKWNLVQFMALCILNTMVCVSSVSTLDISTFSRLAYTVKPPQDGPYIYRNPLLTEQFESHQEIYLYNEPLLIGNSLIRTPNMVVWYQMMI